MKSPLILLLVLLLASVWSPTLLAEESAPIDFVGIYRIGETARVLLRAPSDSAWLTIGQSMGRIQLVGISEDFKSVEVKIGE